MQLSLISHIRIQECSTMAVPTELIFNDDQAFVDTVFEGMSAYQKTLVEQAVSQNPLQETSVSLQLTFKDLLKHTGRKACRKAFISDMTERFKDKGLVVERIAEVDALFLKLPSIKLPTKFTSLKALVNP